MTATNPPAAPRQNGFNLDRIRMNAALTAPGGVVNAETIFEFRQQGSLVSATYAGGRIRLGYLVGTLNGSQLNFRYAQADTDGNLDGGHSRCMVERMPDGRLRIIENFEWASRAGSGTNIFEQLPE